MKRTKMLLLRMSSVSVLGLFLIEALVVDMNGRLFDFSDLVSHASFGGTVSVGIAIACVLLTLDRGWRVLHLGCVAVYVAMLIPMFVG
jgi:hypothetical protein